MRLVVQFLIPHLATCRFGGTRLTAAHTLPAPRTSHRSIKQACLLPLFRSQTLMIIERGSRGAEYETDRVGRGFCQRVFVVRVATVASVK